MKFTLTENAIPTPNTEVAEGLKVGLWKGNSSIPKLFIKNKNCKLPQADGPMGTPYALKEGKVISILSQVPDVKETGMYRECVGTYEVDGDKYIIDLDLDKLP